MTAVPRLLLFDVDGTLILGRRENRRWFAEALVEVFGAAGDIDGHSFSGKIDPQIVTGLSACSTALSRNWTERIGILRHS